MKTYNATKRLSPQAKAAIKSAIETHERYKKSYFWRPGGSASNRHRNEARFEASNPDFQVLTPMGTVEVIFHYRESCSNVYYSMDVYLDNAKKDVRLLRKLIK